MSTKGENLSVLEELGRLRRGLNLMAVQRLKPVGVGPKQALLISHLFSRKICSLAELSKATVTDPAATGRAIDSLVRKGWVEQRAHATDRRRWEILLTAKGRQIAKQVEKLRGELANEVISNLVPEEKKTLLDLLGKLLGGLAEDIRGSLS